MLSPRLTTLRVPYATMTAPRTVSPLRRARGRVTLAPRAFGEASPPPTPPAPMATPRPTPIEFVRPAPRPSEATTRLASHLTTAPELGTREFQLDDPRGLVRALESKGEHQVAERLARLGIEKLIRFRDPSLLLEIMRNRESGSDGDPRPRALLVFPKYDDALSFERNAMKTLVSHAYRVHYYEAESDSTFIDILSAERAKGPVAYFQIAGHGAPGVLAFEVHAENKRPDGMPADEDTLDWSDVDDLRTARLEGLLAKEAVIQLNSCSTGYGKAHYPNVANLLAEIFPDARIYAPTEPAESMPVFDRAGRFVSPGYRLSMPEKTYEILPKQASDGMDLEALIRSRRGSSSR